MASHFCCLLHFQECLLNIQVWNRRHKFYFDKNLVKLHRALVKEQGRAEWDRAEKTFLSHPYVHLLSLAAHDVFQVVLLPKSTLLLFSIFAFWYSFMQNVFVIDKIHFIKIIKQKSLVQKNYPCLQQPPELNAFKTMQYVSEAQQM